MILMDGFPLLLHQRQGLFSIFLHIRDHMKIIIASRVIFSTIRIHPIFRSHGALSLPLLSPPPPRLPFSLPAGAPPALRRRRPLPQDPDLQQAVERLHRIRGKLATARSVAVGVSEKESGSGA